MINKKNISKFKLKFYIVKSIGKPFSSMMRDINNKGRDSVKGSNTHLK